MLHVALCDDNPAFLSEAAALLHDWPGKPRDLHIDSFSDGDSLLLAHAARPYDIMIVDVVMPGLNGIETAEELRLSDKTTKLVFLTSSPEFAVDSYAVKASNYLLKPVKAQALYACMDELYADIRRNARSIIVRQSTAMLRLVLDSIEFVEAQNKQVRFSMADGQNIYCLDPLYSLEPKLLLSDGFFKCHRSYIVNIHQVDSFTPREIRMRSGEVLPISRTYHKEFETAYFSVMFEKTGDAL